MDYMHYQRYPHIHGDLEPAFVVRPHEPCCPDEKEECMCITSGEVDRWNTAAEILSGLSGFTPEDFDKIASAGEIAESADFWNSAYNTLNTNSASWNSVYNTVCSNSATWESAGQIPEILSGMDNLADAISAKSNKLYFDPSSISGDGTPGAPYAVRDWLTNKNIRDDVTDIYNHIIKIPSGVDGYREERWLFDGEHEMLASANAAISGIEKDLEDKTKAINNLSAVALSASAYAMEVRDRCPEYVADDYTIERRLVASGISNTYEFRLKGLPPAYTSAIDLGTEAWQIAKRLDAMNLVSFQEFTPYPTSEGAIRNLTANRTIYYSVEG
jgi:hypothetical protein